MRALAIDELGHVGGGDRWYDPTWIVQDYGSDTVQITARRDGGQVGIGDVMGIAGGLGGLVGGTVNWFALGGGATTASIGAAAALGATAAVAIVLVTVGVYVAVIYFTREGNPDPSVAIP